MTRRDAAARLDRAMAAIETATATLEQVAGELSSETEIYRPPIQFAAADLRATQRRVCNVANLLRAGAERS